MGKRIGVGFFAKKASQVAPKMLGLKLCTKSCSVVLYEVEAYEGFNDAASHAHKLTKRSRIMQETFAHWYVYFIYGNHHCLNITTGKNSAGAVLIRKAVPLKGIELMRKRRKLDARLKNKKNEKKGEVNGGEDVKENEERGDNRFDVKGICDGPGKLCSALGIDKKFNSLALGKKLWLEEINKKEKELLKHNLAFGLMKKKGKKEFGVGSKHNTRVKANPKLKIIALPRVGISKAKKLKWRFLLEAK